VRILVTAGPTREYFDDVRFISNASSGTLGYAIGAEAARRSHQVILVSGPVGLPAPSAVEFVPVITGPEMLDACRRHFENCDAAVMCAAVCDYRPATQTTGKAPKTTQAHSVILEPTEDICAILGRMKERQNRDRSSEPSRDREGAEQSDEGQDRTGPPPRATPRAQHDRILMGFALETDDARARAEAKLRRKRCDAIVLNHPASIGDARTTVEVFTPLEGWSAPCSGRKTDIAAYLVDVIERLAIA